MLIYGIFFSRYQSIGFRVPPELKSYCDANTAKG
jgi:general transcription factor 3C polypeptide 5 (transcription factor C subunit 1)